MFSMNPVTAIRFALCLVSTKVLSWWFYIVWRIKYALNWGNTGHLVTFSFLNAGMEMGNDLNLVIQGNGKIIACEPIQLPGGAVNPFTAQTHSNGIIPHHISTLSLTRTVNAEGNGDNEVNVENAIFINWIRIDERPRFHFHKWIQPDVQYWSHSDTRLPQDDEDTQQQVDDRHFKLAFKRKEYQYELYGNNTNLPVKVRKIPYAENFSLYYIIKNLLIPGIGTKLSQFLINFRLLCRSRWMALGNIGTAYALYFRTPKGMNQWEDDNHFAQQRLNKCNWSLIQLVPNADLDQLQGFNFQQLDASLDANFANEVNGGTVFMTAINITQGMEEFGQIPSPITLFHWTEENGLLPLAIQLMPGQPAFYRPVDNNNSWNFAKMWCNVADASVHLAIVHLGLTHILMEGIAINLHRNLSDRHPIYKLIAPHFYYNIAINNLARKALLNHGGYIDKTMNIGVEGAFQLIRNAVDGWHMNVDGTLPANLAARGIADNNVAQTLPGFFYANDGLRLYNTIRAYVDAYVNHYYSGQNDADQKIRLLADVEIQAFCKDLNAPRAPVNSGLGIKGVPSTNDQFQTLEQLIDTLTSIIVTCSVTHAATNFPQYDEYGYPPNYTTKLQGVPPNTVDEVTDEDIVNNLPTVNETFSIMEIFTVLSQHTTKPLGDYEVKYIDDPAALIIFQQFKTDLVDVRDAINIRNTQIEVQNTARTANNQVVFQQPYTQLLPQNIPNSVAI